MIAAELIPYARHLGFRLEPRPGAGLVVSPASRLPAELADELRHHKTEIIRLLTETAGTSDSDSPLPAETPMLAVALMPTVALCKEWGEGAAARPAARRAEAQSSYGAARLVHRLPVAPMRQPATSRMAHQPQSCLLLDHRQNVGLRPAGLRGRPRRRLLAVGSDGSRGLGSPRWHRILHC